MDTQKSKKNYVMEIINTEEVMDRLNMSQYRFRKIEKIGWWDSKNFSADAGTQLNSTDF